MCLGCPTAPRMVQSDCFMVTFCILESTTGWLYLYSCEGQQLVKSGSLVENQSEYDYALPRNWVSLWITDSLRKYFVIKKSTNLRVSESFDVFASISDFGVVFTRANSYESWPEPKFGVQVHPPSVSLGVQFGSHASNHGVAEFWGGLFLQD